MRKIVLFMLLLPLLAGCLKDDYVDYTAIDEEIIVNYLAENNIEAQRHSLGLYYKIIDKGSGAPISDDISKDEKVTFSYKGYLTSGKVFADTKGENVTQYLSRLLIGFQIGFPHINREGEMQLFIPSGMAYGSTGANGVPANSVVIFDVKIDRDQSEIDEDILVAFLEENNIEAERDESGLYYQIIEPGEGNNATDYSIIDASYTGTLMNGEEFETGTLSRAPLSNLIEAWRVGIPKLKKGGKAVFYCPSQLCYGSSPQYDKDGKITIPANSILVFEIELVNFQ